MDDGVTEADIQADLAYIESYARAAYLLVRDRLPVPLGWVQRMAELASRIEPRLRATNYPTA